MKKLVFAALAATMALGAVSTASAYGYRDCKMMADFGRSSGSLAKDCARFIPGEGQISSGKHEGEQWGKVFKDTVFGDNIAHIKVHKEKNVMDISGKRTTYIYKTTDGKEAIKTKKISGWNWLSYLSQIGGTSYKVVE